MSGRPTDIKVSQTVKSSLCLIVQGEITTPVSLKGIDREGRGRDRQVCARYIPTVQEFIVSLTNVIPECRSYCSFILSSNPAGETR